MLRRGIVNPAMMVEHKASIDLREEWLKCKQTCESTPLWVGWGVTSATTGVTTTPGVDLCM
ncbi:hypothetical protein Pmani_003246 [Petrolisthes manimaculis]|uniref:Uncharacterized protein n=1 Tax=Petrolisthes manimaculis TaxID=1843537 RepID=A0AAE1QIX8_9EUCA|nr:hypothetical protein Pmani_003246 [Petrolisthes manimaculis]